MAREQEGGGRLDGLLTVCSAHTTHTRVRPQNRTVTPIPMVSGQPAPKISSPPAPPLQQQQQQQQQQPSPPQQQQRPAAVQPAPAPAAPGLRRSLPTNVASPLSSLTTSSCLFFPAPSLSRSRPPPALGTDMVTSHPRIHHSSPAPGARAAVASRCARSVVLGLWRTILLARSADRAATLPGGGRSHKEGAVSL